MPVGARYSIDMHGGSTQSQLSHIEAHMYANSHEYRTAESRRRGRVLLYYVFYTAHTSSSLRRPGHTDGRLAVVIHQVQERLRAGDPRHEGARVSPRDAFWRAGRQAVWPAR